MILSEAARMGNFDFKHCSFAVFLLMISFNSCFTHPPGYSVNVTLPPEAVAQFGLGKNSLSSNILRATRGPCECLDGTCKCCTGVSFASLGQKFCANMEYDPDEFQLAVSMSMNDKTLYRRAMSAKNPRPICLPLPRLRFITMCTKFSNVYLTGRNIHACIDMEGRIFDASMFEMSFDCVRVGAEGVALLSPEDGGGLPSTQPVKPAASSVDEDEDYDQLNPEDYANENLQEDIYEPTPITPVKNNKKSKTTTARPSTKPSSPNSQIVRIQPTKSEIKFATVTENVAVTSLVGATYITIDGVPKNKRKPRE